MGPLFLICSLWMTFSGIADAEPLLPPPYAGDPSALEDEIKHADVTTQEAFSEIFGDLQLPTEKLAGFDYKDIYTAAFEAQAAYYSYKLDTHVKEVPHMQSGNITVFSSPAEHSGIVVFKKNGQVTIVYHGTSSLRNMATDIWALGTTVFFAQGYVHSGFYYGFLRSWDELYPIIADYAASRGQTVSDLDITVTGHSMGGALATICGYRLAKISKVEKLRVITFASPRVLSFQCAFDYDTTHLGNTNTTLGQQTLRVAQEGDPVTKVPSSMMGYKHVGLKLSVKRHKDYVHHTMAGYIIGVEESIKKQAFRDEDPPDDPKRYKLNKLLDNIGVSPAKASLHEILVPPWYEDPEKIIEKTYKAKN